METNAQNFQEKPKLLVQLSTIFDVIFGVSTSSNRSKQFKFSWKQNYLKKKKINLLTNYSIFIQTETNKKNQNKQKMQAKQNL